MKRYVFLILLLASCTPKHSEFTVRELDLMNKAQEMGCLKGAIEFRTANLFQPVDLHQIPTICESLSSVTGN